MSVSIWMYVDFTNQVFANPPASINKLSSTYANWGRNFKSDRQGRRSASIYRYSEFNLVLTHVIVVGCGGDCYDYLLFGFWGTRALVANLCKEKKNKIRRKQQNTYFVKIKLILISSLCKIFTVKHVCSYVSICCRQIIESPVLYSSPDSRFAKWGSFVL